METSRQGDRSDDRSRLALAKPTDLPSIDRLMRQAGAIALVAEHGHTLVTREARALADALRSLCLSGQLPLADTAPPAMAAALARNIEARLQPRMGCVINLSGTVIHTNLGRAVLADSALQHVLATMAGPNNLEYDLVKGDRGDRDSIVEDLLCQLTGAQAATVVNNNAAAVLLTIAALARQHAPGREVIISRGELVEIGGAFRMPDVMACAGAVMVEVGTTNRTHPHDYAAAINERTALLMKVHTSNYVVQGFASAVDEATLADLAHARGLPLATDLGSGALVDLTAWGLPHEPTPQQMIKAGSDAVTFSGDKLLGGPQAGLIVGTRATVDCIRKFPMKRALRIGKLPLAALEATLRLYLRPERLARDLPTLRMLTRPQAQIVAVAERVAPAVAGALAPRFGVATAKMMSQIGSGALPVDLLPSAGLVITPAGVAKKGIGTALAELAAALRDLPTPVIARVANDALRLDLRALEDPGVLLAQLPLLRGKMIAC